MIATPAIRQQSKQPSTRAAALVTVPSRTPSLRPPARNAASRTGTVASTSATLPALEQTLHTLLSPMEFNDWKSWQVAVHARLLARTGADALCVYTPLATAADAWLSPHLSDAALCNYAASSSSPTRCTI
jgi:hypothetical protein